MHIDKILIVDHELMKPWLPGEALRSDIDDLVGRPVNLDKLRFILSRVLQAKRQRSPVLLDKSRVLIVCDAAERILGLQSAFDPHHIEVTSVVFPEEWSYAGGGHYDLALVDVGPELLEPLLKTIRTNNAQAEITVLSTTREGDCNALPTGRQLNTIDAHAVAMKRCSACSTHHRLNH